MTRRCALYTQLRQLARGGVREGFERRFTARRMVKDYLGIYEALAQANISQSPCVC
jgi:hypothetical protein